MKYGMVYKTSLSDAQLEEMFAHVSTSGRLEQLFYDREIATPEEFIALVRREDTHFWTVSADGRTTGMFWLAGLYHGTAHIHFCMFGVTHPLTELRLARYAVREVLNLRDEHGVYLLEVLHGTTPLWNRAACRWIELVGFRPVATLPLSAWRAETATLEPVLLSYTTRELMTGRIVQ